MTVSSPNKWGRIYVFRVLRDTEDGAKTNNNDNSSLLLRKLHVLDESLFENDRVSWIDWVQCGRVDRIAASFESGKYFAYWNMSSSKPHATLIPLRSIDSRPNSKLCWNAKGTKLAFASSKVQPISRRKKSAISIAYYLEEVDEWHEKHLQLHKPGQVLDVAFHPDGILLAAGELRNFSQVMRLVEYCVDGSSINI
eukprot:TRINITY_DN5782_c0_g1_i2.p1 TRINITY_DN5782_c0_g1~~TRINITY_DN5782_c0_g1_i2.p1  ORF type:complete len:196 (+),score=29.55 TRINITY_DN5782_c0_g1_i2:139-726(+)